MKKVVVIGSNSFSGADFIDLLMTKTDYEIIGISRSPEKSPLFLAYLQQKDLSQRYRFFQADLNRDMDAVQALLTQEKPEYVVNFAAQSEVAPSWQNPGQWFQTNAVAIANLGNFLRYQDWLERYVHISSPEVYGTCEGIVREDGLLNPTTPYAASKAAGDLMLFTLSKNFDFPLSMVRATNVYGVGQQLFKIIPRTMINLNLGKKIQLHGGGTAVKSYIHIRDVSEGELRIMEQGKSGEIYHLSPGSGVSIRHLVSKICSLKQKRFEDYVETVPERQGQDKAYVIDSKKARQHLNWDDKISLDTGLQQVINWIDQHMDLIQKEPLEYIHKP